ncbi:rho GTPase-activating protein gacF-like [Hyalella azteca]|uniref:Rho GTPase-activating protein gacF-like n=1 Tax=Hyalella azteca TaxID=294128 RepID=A0A8B7MYC6_HYAAZ|nr:rho GTPase-activating protein gacF-like [Hyalella azteca]
MSVPSFSLASESRIGGRDRPFRGDDSFSTTENPDCNGALGGLYGGEGVGAVTSISTSPTKANIAFVHSSASDNNDRFSDNLGNCEYVPGVGTSSGVTVASGGTLYHDANGKVDSCLHMEMSSKSQSGAVRFFPSSFVSTCPFNGSSSTMNSGNYNEGPSINFIPTTNDVIETSRVHHVNYEASVEQIETSFFGHSENKFDKTSFSDIRNLASTSETPGCCENTALEILPLVVESLNRSQLAVPELPPRPDSNCSAMSVSFVFPDPPSASVEDQSSCSRDQKLIDFIEFNNRKLSLSEISKSSVVKKNKPTLAAGVSNADNSIRGKHVYKLVGNSGKLESDVSTLVREKSPHNSEINHSQKRGEDTRSKLDSIFSRFFPKSKNGKKKTQDSRGLPPVSSSPFLPLPTSQHSSLHHPSSPSTSSQSSMCLPLDSNVYNNNNNNNNNEEKNGGASLFSTSKNNICNNSYDGNANKASCPSSRPGPAKLRKPSVARSRYRRRRKNTSSVS